MLSGNFPPFPWDSSTWTSPPRGLAWEVLTNLRLPTHVHEQRSDPEGAMACNPACHD